MATTRGFLGKVFSGVLGWFRAPFEEKEDKPNEPIEPVLEEFFDDACEFVLVGVLDSRMLKHVVDAARRAKVSFRLANTGDVPAAPPGKQPVVLAEDVTAQTVSAWKAAMPTARVVQLAFHAAPDTAANLAKLGVDDCLVVPVTPFTIQEALKQLAKPVRKPRKQPMQAGNVKLEWLDEAEQNLAALEKSGMSRRKFARKVAISPAKLDNFCSLAALDDGCKAFLREHAVWFRKAQSLVLLAMKLPAEALPAFLREYVERQQRGDDVTLKVAKQMIAERTKEAG